MLWERESLGRYIVRESRKIIWMIEPAYDLSISAASSGVEFYIRLGSDTRAYSCLGQRWQAKLDEAVGVSA